MQRLEQNSKHVAARMKQGPLACFADADGKGQRASYPAAVGPLGCDVTASGKLIKSPIVV